jgi:hypothetical protein
MSLEKAKVTKITRMDKLDNYGNTSFVIEFDNGMKGFYTSKNPNQTKFVVGNVADFNIEEKQGSKGVYYKISVPQTDVKSFGGGKAPIDPKVQMISFAMSYCKDCIVAGKVPLSDLEKEFNRIYNVMISKL